MFYIGKEIGKTAAGGALTGAAIGTIAGPGGSVAGAIAGVFSAEGFQNIAEAGFVRLETLIKGVKMNNAFIYSASVIIVSLICLILLRKILLKFCRKHNLTDPVLVEMPCNGGILACIVGLLFIIYVNFIK